MHAAEIPLPGCYIRLKFSADYNWFVEKYLLLRYIVVSIVILCLLAAILKPMGD